MIFIGGRFFTNFIEWCLWYECPICWLRVSHKVAAISRKHKGISKYSNGYDRVTKEKGFRDIHMWESENERDSNRENEWVRSDRCFYRHNIVEGWKRKSYIYSISHSILIYCSLSLSFTHSLRCLLPHTRTHSLVRSLVHAVENVLRIIRYVK